MFNNFPAGFLVCAVVMTFFPGVAVKINKGVRTGTRSLLTAYASWQLKRQRAKQLKNLPKSQRP